MSAPAPPEPSKPLTLRAVSRELADELFSVDRGMLHTFVRLWVEPSAATQRYVERRDARLTPPARYLVVAIAVSTAVTWFVMSKLGLASHLGLKPSQVAQSEWVSQNTGWLVLLVLPPVIAVLRVFDRQRGAQAWASAAVLVAYTQAQSLWAQLLVVIPLAYLPTVWASGAASVVLSVWLLWAWTRYLGRPWWRAGLGALLAVVLGTLVNQLALWALWRWFGPG
jgi:hypothetical protein